MVDTDLAVARLRLATDQAEALQQGLRQRQDDLLSLEEGVRHMSTGRSIGHVVTDQAEDIRRAVNIHASEQIEDIRTALARADMAIGDAAFEGTLAPDQARVLAHMVTVAGEETRRATMDLHDVAHALTPTAQAVPGEPGLAETAQAGVDQAANRLEHARRAVFRVVEDLPVLTRAVQAIPESDQQTLELDVTAQPTIASQHSLGVIAGQRPPSSMSAVHSAGVTPDR